MHHAEVHVSNRLNAAEIAELMAVAGSRRPTDESERIDAVKRLLCEYRLQIAEYKANRDHTPDPLLIQGIDNWGRQIFAEPDPTLALARFLGQKSRPGKRATHTERDLSIAIAVVREMRGGNTLERAAEAVGLAYNLAPETVSKIYGLRHKEAKADLAMSALEEGAHPPPPLKGPRTAPD
jgi:hypothetical protein